MLLFVIVMLSLFTVVSALVSPESYGITSLAAFAMGIAAGVGLAHLAARSKWRGRTFTLWVTLLQVIVILGVPLLSWTIFPDWQTSASTGTFQSAPRSFFDGFAFGLVLLVIYSVQGLWKRWKSF